MGWPGTRVFYSGPIDLRFRRCDEWDGQVPKYFISVQSTSGLGGALNGMARHPSRFYKNRENCVKKV